MPIKSILQGTTLLFGSKEVAVEVKLDPVGSTVLYEMMKLCIGSV